MGIFSKNYIIVNVEEILSDICFSQFQVPFRADKSDGLK